MHSIIATEASKNSTKLLQGNSKSFARRPKQCGYRSFWNSWFQKLIHKVISSIVIKIYSLHIHVVSFTQKSRASFFKIHKYLQYIDCLEKHDLHLIYDRWSQFRKCSQKTDLRNVIKFLIYKIEKIIGLDDFNAENPQELFYNVSCNGFFFSIAYIYSLMILFTNGWKYQQLETKSLGNSTVCQAAVKARH